ANQAAPRPGRVILAAGPLWPSGTARRSPPRATPGPEPHPDRDSLEPERLPQAVLQEPPVSGVRPSAPEQDERGWARGDLRPVQEPRGSSRRRPLTLRLLEDLVDAGRRHPLGPADVRLKKDAGNGGHARPAKRGRPDQAGAGEGR